MVAAHFACCEQYEGDSAIFVLDRKDIGLGRVSDNPLCLKETVLLEPYHHSPRITNQSCVFTVHIQPHIEYGNEFVAKWIIKKECFGSMSVRLEKFGINPTT